MCVLFSILVTLWLVFTVTTNKPCSSDDEPMPPWDLPYPRHRA